MTRRWRALAAIAFALFVIGAVVASPEMAAADGAPITGGGSSYAQLEVDQWRADTAHAPYNLNINYSAQGSTFGRTQYLSGQLDYGVSDIPFQIDEAPQVAASSRKTFTYVPISAGGLGFMYNLTTTGGARVTNLHLTPTAVCRAFTEPQMYWDDPAITAENPGVALPHDIIRPVVRSDGSGTSFVFSSYCIKVAPTVWQAFISYAEAQSQPDQEFRSGQASSNWPYGFGNFASANAADGVADYVANAVSGKDTITYNAPGFATDRGFPNAWVKNAAGVYHQPDAAAASVALAYAQPRPDGTFDLRYDAPDPTAYFPSTYSYVIAQTTGFNTAKGQTLGAFLNYAVTLGQRRAVPLGYAQLSTVLVNEALDHIQQIPGAPPRPTDLGNPPPPPRTSSGIGAGAVPTGSKSTGGAGASTPGGKGSAGARGPAGGVAGSGATTETTSTLPGTAPAAAEAPPSVDVSHLPPPKSAPPPDDSKNFTLPSKPISNKEVAWTFLLGFGLLAVGSVVGVGAAAAKGSARGPVGS